jgi:hypothetical protein
VTACFVMMMMMLLLLMMMMCLWQREAMLGVWESMTSRGVRPNRLAIHALMKLHMRGGALREVLRLLDEWDPATEPPRGNSFNLAIRECFGGAPESLRGWEAPTSTSSLAICRAESVSGSNVLFHLTLAFLETTSAEEWRWSSHTAVSAPCDE